MHHSTQCTCYIARSKKEANEVTMCSVLYNTTSQYLLIRRAAMQLPQVPPAPRLAKFVQDVEVEHGGNHRRVRARLADRDSVAPLAVDDRVGREVAILARCAGCSKFVFRLALIHSARLVARAARRGW
jgi:hypothetical protein